MEKEIKAGSNLPAKIESKKLQEIKADTGKLGLPSGSFSGFATWRGNGVVVINLTHPNINANSRVFVSISEFNSDAAVNRFIGDAWYQVYNIAPYDGGVHVRFSIGWSDPLNIRFDVLVDP